MDGHGNVIQLSPIETKEHDGAKKLTLFGSGPENAGARSWSAGGQLPGVWNFFEVVMSKQMTASTSGSSRHLFTFVDKLVGDWVQAHSKRMEYFGDEFLIFLPKAKSGVTDHREGSRISRFVSTMKEPEG
jgi:hypothetical protein